ncbi:MAG: TetR/AcrR family transcriptional regulator [Alcanivoracaceae bacterium]
MNIPSLTELLAKGADTGASTQAGERILDAALSLFVEFGLRRNTMDDVAQRAGVGRATVYRHFGDKDRLVQAVILREIQRNLLIIEERVRKIASPVDALLEAFVLSVSMAHDNALLKRLLTSEPETSLPYLTVHYGQTMDLSRLYLAARIRDAQKADAMGPIDADAGAEIMLRLLQSLLLTPAGGVQASDRDSLRTFADQCLRPLFSL